MAKTKNRQPEMNHKISQLILISHHPIIHLPNRLHRTGLAFTNCMRVHVDRGGSLIQ